MKTKPNQSMNLKVGRVTPCAPQLATHAPNGAHGVTRPTDPRSSWPRCPLADRGFLLTSALFLAAVSICLGQPIITNQPATQATAPGASVTFQVGATGTAPLVYQWQKNPGNGFSDLADRTNAALVLTNVQPWDACDYRVVITNITGARTSAVARLYVMRPALVTTKMVVDNFDDDLLTDWEVFGSGSFFNTNQQLTVRGYYPGVHTVNHTDSQVYGGHYTTWAVPNGQTREWRVDLVRLDENATNTALLLVGTTSGLYAVHKSRDFVFVLKWPTSGGGICILACERAAVRNTNVVLTLALTRVQPNLLVTARVLDKANLNNVLYQCTVVDTPNVDPTINAARFQAVDRYELAGCGSC
ncbi:MAG: immunoglobulin domain-containing protein [Verrucomicrobia bacterium]|nr:immunoglobulin domain-containing protein [Verrucomicrobiota bacterium]